MMRIGRLAAPLLALAIAVASTTTAGASTSEHLAKSIARQSPHTQAPLAAPAGYTIVTNSVDNPSGATTSDGVSCPRGTKAWGGGVFNTSGSLSVNINSSWPGGNLGGNGWQGYTNNASASDNTMTVYAVCANPGTGYTIVGST